MTTARQFVVVLRCPERKGIVAAVSGLLAEQNQTILESSQYSDPSTHTFFMRVLFQADEGATAADRAALTSRFQPIADAFHMEWELHDVAEKPRVVIMVSKFGHCLNDLLHRWRSGLLPVEIVGVISNHDDMRSFVEWNGVPYHYLPVTKDTKTEQEAQIMALLDDLDVDLVVLAR